MTAGHVFDTEAIVALLYGEPGSDVVGEIFDDVVRGERAGYLADANAAEVFYLVARIEGDVDGSPTSHSLEIADRDVRALERAGLTIATPDWRTVGEVKAHGSISLADASGVALAADRDATLLVGGDDDFEGLPLEVSIERFRTDPV